MATTATATATTPSSTSTKKLSGWAQAAARAAPPNSKLAQKKSEKLVEVKSTKTGVSPVSSTLPKKKDTSLSNNNNHHNHNHNHKKNSNRLPYNRNEVRTYMNDLFAKYANDTRTVSYKSIVGTSKNIPATNWGTVQSKNNKNKNKKYGLLVNIAKVLKN